MRLFSLPHSCVDLCWRYKLVVSNYVQSCNVGYTRISSFLWRYRSISWSYRCQCTVDATRLLCCRWHKTPNWKVSSSFSFGFWSLKPKISLFSWHKLSKLVYLTGAMNGKKNSCASLKKPKIVECSSIFASPGLHHVHWIMNWSGTHELLCHISRQHSF